jgi:glycosyltransferase involved in cell wall biosynthesis
MDFSVIVCTYNRSHHLKNVLKSLSMQVATKGLRWEIIVVDNNSTDNTFNIVKEFKKNSKVPVKYVREEKQGLSHARNRGIIESRGKYIAFIDDDAIADNNWVAALYKAFQRNECDCVGGRIYLKPLKKLPRWLKKELWAFLAYLDYGDKPFQVTDHYIFGTNMAFTREILNRVGFFNVKLGRSAYVPAGGEETELFKRISKTGGRIYYCPDAKVHHMVEEYKLKKKYFRRLHYYDGLNNGKVYNGEIKRHFRGIPFFIFPQFLRGILKFAKSPTLRMQMNIWWSLGFMKGRVLEYKNRH